MRVRALDSRAAELPVPRGHTAIAQSAAGGAGPSVRPPPPPTARPPVRSGTFPPPVRPGARELPRLAIEWRKCPNRSVVNRGDGSFPVQPEPRGRFLFRFSRRGKPPGREPRGRFLFGSEPRGRFLFGSPGAGAAGTCIASGTFSPTVRPGRARTREFAIEWRHCPRRSLVGRGSMGRPSELAGGASDLAGPIRSGRRASPGRRPPSQAGWSPPGAIAEERSASAVPRGQRFSWAYRPPVVSSSSCRPRSMIRPAASTTISSASRTVLRRCAIVSVVRPAIR